MREKMVDLIYRQVAIDALAKHEKSNGHNYTLFVDIVSECAEIIRDLPPAHLVRCRDCKHHEDEEPGMVYCPDQVGGWVRDDFFCADGERRDDG